MAPPYIRPKVSANSLICSLHTLAQISPKGQGQNLTKPTLIVQQGQPALPSPSPCDTQILEPDSTVGSKTVVAFGDPFYRANLSITTTTEKISQHTHDDRAEPQKSKILHTKE